MIYCVGDLGGTHLRLAVASGASGHQLEHLKIFRTADFPSLSAALECYSKELDIHFDVISIAAAGPVNKGKCQLTNLSWSINTSDIMDQMDCRAAFLLNDLEAYAYGIPWVDSNDFLSLQKGQDNTVGNQCLMAVGTGLGEALILWDGNKFVPSATEGGHTSFSPNGDFEIDLLINETKKVGGHVSWERILSGAYGFQAILDIYRKDASLKTDILEIEQENSSPEVGPKIFESFRKGNKLAKCILHKFAELYGSEAGNLCLKSLARGGVFIAGSIAQKILIPDFVPSFLEAFSNKGRFKNLLEEIPIRLVQDDLCSLKGSLRFALMQKGSNQELDSFSFDAFQIESDHFIHERKL